MQRTVTLNGGSPWGFRLVGGSDFRANLAISKITPGGKAELAGLRPGDLILAINNSDTSNITHLEAQNQVKASKTVLSLKIESPNSQPILSPSVTKSSATIPNNKSTYPPKPSKFTTPNAPTKIWQPIRPKPPSVSSNNASTTTVNANNEDYLSKPSAKDAINTSLHQLSHPNKTKKADDFPPPLPSSNRSPPPPVSPSPKSPQFNNSKDLICEGCKLIIRGPYLTAQGKNWHPEEFVCSSPSCRRPLQNCGFIEEKGQRYCASCYEKYFANTCGKCNEKIVGEVMHALNQTWHVNCFVCTACGNPFRDGVFHLENEKPYCVADYNRLFSTLCKGCGFAIEAGDHYVEAVKSQWHEACFTCSVCHCDLKNSGFYAVNDKPVCSNHKDAKLPA